MLWRSGAQQPDRHNIKIKNRGLGQYGVEALIAVLLLGMLGWNGLMYMSIGDKESNVANRDNNGAGSADEQDDKDESVQ